MRSTVASGPMPPIIPTTRCVDLAAKVKVIDVAEQSRAAARVYKHDVLTLLEHSLANQIQESGHAFACVDRIKQNSFEAGKGLNGVERTRRRESVPGADVVAVCDDILSSYRPRHAAQLGGRAGQLEDVFLLAFPGCANAYA